MHPTGKTLFQDTHGRLWVVSRETDRDGSHAFGLAPVELVYIEAYKHKYEAIAAADKIDDETRGR